jgi:fatty-acyl-CoA synthase
MTTNVHPSIDENTAPWVDGLTIPQVLKATAGRFPDHDALVFPALGLRVSYREFSDEVDLAARGLAALDIEHGEHVAIWATNVPEWVVLQFAAARVGAVLVNINPAYRAFELKYVLNQSDSVALFLVSKFKSSDYFAMLADVCPELASSRPGQLHATDFPKLRWVVALEKDAPSGAITWAEMRDRAQAVPRARLDELDKRLDPQQPINIQYTSGTTGFPKAAMLSHRNLLFNGYYTGMCQALTALDRVCIPVPFYHCFGCVL